VPRAVDTHAAPVALLRVLLVEDCAADANLIVEGLRDSGFEPSCRRVETERDYLAHLTPDVDLIVADYTLPEFDALRALTLSRECGFDIPFIIVSGMLGEDQAVAAMKNGAADYLSKDRMARLGQAVRHAIEAADLRRANACAEVSAQLVSYVRGAIDGVPSPELKGPA
jgi:DNA-binding NtrC family response regulator